jgi:hypothetical protein
LTVAFSPQAIEFSRAINRLHRRNGAPGVR